MPEREKAQSPTPFAKYKERIGTAEKMQYKLGSLFDGSGGFPLAGTLCGIEPRWASEVEPYPIAVTRSRFPKMKHLGDISKVNGAEIEPVDIITFGSPCQDLSVAGKQAGIAEGTRSGLFIEAVRIIKEMRSATNGKYPSFALWENVPGAFSSNKGEDFRIVLEELIKIVEPCASVPEVPPKGWSFADNYVGDGWSLAYRVLDAQYWGVPQRRRRIHLVLDLRGERARDVLFKREGLRGYSSQSGTPWQDSPAEAQRSPRADDREGEGIDPYNATLTGDKASTLGVNCGLSTGRSGVVYDARGNGDGGTVSTVTGNNNNRITDYSSVVVEPLPEYIVRRLTPAECARLQGFPDKWGHPLPKNELTEEELLFWKEVRNTHAVINGRAVKDYTAKQMLTWYNKLHTDSAEYKMWGNGIALPTALYCMQGMADALRIGENDGRIQSRGDSGLITN